MQLRAESTVAVENRTFHVYRRARTTSWGFSVLIVTVLMAAGCNLTAANVSTPVSTASEGGAQAPSDDFERRCRNEHVLRCFDFDSEAAISRRIDPAGDGVVRARIVRDIAASGAGSLHFEVPARAGANMSGNFHADFSDDLNTQFGEGQEFFIQWRQRFDEGFLASKAGDGWKQLIVGEGNRPGKRAYSCTDFHLVVTNAYNRGFPIMYHSCGFKDGEYEGLHPYVPDRGGDWLFQNATGCKRSNPGQECVRYAPNEWMTFQVHVKVGRWYYNDRNYQRNSTVQLWIARENQPSKLALSVTDYDLAHPKDNPSANYGQVWLLPYTTGRDSSVGYPAGSTWYDDLIISRRRIPDPNVSTPNPPDSLTAKAVDNGSVELNWRSNSRDEKAFVVERCQGTQYQCDHKQGFVALGEAAAGQSRYIDRTARAGTAYTYRVKARNANGDSAYTNSAASLPAPPSSLQAVVTQDGHVLLRWADNSEDETAFAVERCEGDQQCARFDEVAKVNRDTTTYTDANVRQGATYTYRVRSLNAAGSRTWWKTGRIGYSNAATLSLRR